jgi:hypothetical protein
MTPLQGNLSSASSIFLGLAVLAALSATLGWIGFWVGLALFFI